MSVYYVNTSEGEVDGDNNGQSATNSGAQSEAQIALSQFWPKVTDEIRKINNLDLKTQALPLARIKKIMKLDDDVKMISAEAPMLFAKASEIFIHELTLRAWVHTEDNKRRTLQRNDIAMAITKFDQFDFLIDIVPREEAKTSKAVGDAAARTTMNPDQVQYYFQLAQQHQAVMNQNSQTSGTAVQLVQPQQVQTVSVASAEASSGSAAPQQVILQQQQAAPAAQQAVVQQQATQSAAIQIVQQVMGPNGEIQNIPINLTPQQMQMIRLQIQGNSSQPIVIQAPQTIQHNQAQQQLIQVSQQAGGATPVYLSQANNTDTE